MANLVRKQQIERELRFLLEETAAYRSYYLRADENDLIRLSEPKIG
jgi:hypothetical protein